MLCVLKKRAALQFQENSIPNTTLCQVSDEPRTPDPATQHELQNFFRGIVKVPRVDSELWKDATPCGGSNRHLDDSTKLCAICGDSARCVNFGGFSYSCESCKSFFRRSHMNNAYRSYRCTKGFHCTIDVETRKGCSYCRYQRCLINGMDSRYLRSEKVKAANLARKRTATCSSVVATIAKGSKSLEITQKLDPIHPQLMLHDQSRIFCNSEFFNLENLYSKYTHSFYNIPYSEESRLMKDDNLRAASVLTETLQRVFFFCFLLPEFCQLDFYDQILLLTKGASDLGLVNAAIGYDVEEGRWPRKGIPMYQTTNLTKHDLEKVIGQEQSNRETSFIVALQDLRPDEHTVMLLFLLILFSPSRGNLRNPVLVARYQMHFARMFRSYLDWRYGTGHGQTLFNKYVSKATELRNISGVIDGISNFCELHPELNSMKCCKAFLALNFSSGSVSVNCNGRSSSN